ncbi:MAG: lysophospholipid acyltransferase family protein [Anaerolineales bacterium]
MTLESTLPQPASTPRSLSQHLGHSILALFGWRFEMTDPGVKKYVLIGAPHTSNWDFILMLLVMLAGKLPIRWLGKDTAFRGPLGLLMRALGGIPVNRRERTRLVEQIANRFTQSESLIIAIAPEGTRSNSLHWKSGFYYMALTANVPIVMGYLDYANRRCGLGPSFVPSGDIHADFEIIRDFYKDIRGKAPHKQGKIALAPDK